MQSKIDTAYSRLSIADRQFLEQLQDAPLLGSLSVAQERERMRNGQLHRLEDFPVRVEEYATSACAVHIIRPLTVDGSLPITFYLHGGGWVLGDLQTHGKLVCELALRSQRAVAFVEFPRAPEHPFPASARACAEAIVETLAAADSLGLNAERFLLAGDSSGANLIMAVVQMMREKQMPQPGGLVLLYPVADCAMNTASYREFGNNRNLSIQTMQWFWNHYLPEQDRRSDVLASPLRAGVETFAGLPPTLIITCEYDVLRDEGEELAAALISAGVSVTAVRWLGALHGFLVTEALAASPMAENCIEFIAQFCRKAGSGC